MMKLDAGLITSSPASEENFFPQEDEETQSAEF